MRNNHTKILTAGASRILSRHPHTIREWADRGFLKCQRDKLGNRVFDLDALLAFKANLEMCERMGLEMGRTLFRLSAAKEDSDG
jgi:hypothetical protein